MPDQPQAQTVAAWMDRITQLHPKQVKLGLERVSQQALRADLLHWSCPVILVGGTNGKGSCVKLLEQIYCHAGYRVASYTSPHLVHFNERISLNGQMVDDDTLMAAFKALDVLIPDGDSTFFEYTTLAALQVFKVFRPDVMICEVGLGGRLDATNILQPDVSIITSIGLDHCEYLGDTREAIANEKSGIFRADGIAICGDLESPSTILASAQRVGTTLRQVGEYYDFHTHGDYWHYVDQKDALYLPMPRLKLQNAATVVCAIQALQARLPVRGHILADAIRLTDLAGRFEYVQQPMPMMLDVAHNHDAAQHLADQCRQADLQNLTAVVGILKTKDIASTLAPLLPFVAQWHIVDLPDERGASAVEIAQVLANMGQKNCYTWASVAAALSHCSEEIQQPSTSPLLVFGSFVTVGLAKQWAQASVARRDALEYAN